MPKESRLPILFKKWLRVNEDASPQKLQEGELRQLENMVLDNPIGIPSIRGGFQEINANFSGNVGKFIDVKSKNGTNYALQGESTKVVRQQGGTLTTVKSGLTSGDNGYFQHSSYGDDIIITNQKDAPFRLSGNDLSTTTDLEIAKPAVEGMYVQIVNGSVGSLDASSIYYWALVYVTEVGERSNPSNPTTTFETQGQLLTTSAGQRQVLLSNMPVSSDDRVVSKWLFRTEGWDGSDEDSGKIFYLRAKIDNDETNFVDGLADEDLDFSETLIFSRVPEIANHIVQSNNRLFLGGITVHEKSFFSPPMVAPPKGASTIYKEVTYDDNGAYTAGNLEIYSDQEYLGTTLLTNPNFVSDTFWVKGTGWTIATGVASSDGTQTADSDLSQPVDPIGKTGQIIAGRTYDVTFTISNYSAGNVTPVVGGTEGTDRSSNGTHTETIVAGADGEFALRADLNFVGDVDTVVFGAGGLTDSEYYQWMYTYVDVNGFESEPTYGVVEQVGSSSGFREVEISPMFSGGLGANSYSNNPDLVFRKIYRTEGSVTTFTANANPFYFVAQQDIRHEAPLTDQPYYHLFFDDLLDTRLGSAYAETTKQHKSAIAWSQNDRPAYFVLENIRQIFRDDQDRITGMLDDGNGILIFKENSIIKLYHTGHPQNWYIRKVWVEHGCDDDRTLIKAGAQIYFMYRKRAYEYLSGGVPQEISYGKQTLLDTITTYNDVIASEKWIHWFVNDGTNDYMVIWDRRVKTWYQFNFYNQVVKSGMIKRYDGFWTEGDLYIIKTKSYHYDETSIVDDFYGDGTVPEAVLGKVKLPRLQIDGLTKFHLRDMAISLTQNATDIVTNGAFSADTDWTKGTGWSIGGGEASCSGAQVADTLLYQLAEIKEGQMYAVTYTMDSQDGLSNVYVGGTLGTTRNAQTGTFTDYVIAGSTDLRIGIQGNLSFTGTIDDLSIIPVTSIIFEDQAGVDTALKTPLGNGIKRVLGFGGKGLSEYADLTIQGAFSLPDFRVDLRPVRRGVGTL
jgi:hypothetical protein